MMMSSRREQLSLAGTTRVIWFRACARYWPCRGVAGLHVVKCLVAWGTLGKRLTSGKVNFLHASVRFDFHEARGFGEWLQGLNYIYNYICSG